MQGRRSDHAADDANAKTHEMEPCEAEVHEADTAPSLGVAMTAAGLGESSGREGWLLLGGCNVERGFGSALTPRLFGGEHGSSSSSPSSSSSHSDRRGN